MPWVAGDTPFVLDGTNAFLTCVSHHDLHGCGYTGTLNYSGLMSPIGDWPLLQHVPDLVAVGLGADSHPTRTRVLEVLNVLGIVGAVVLARAALARTGRTEWFWVFLLAIMTGPVLWFARTTFGEPLAAGLLVALVAATVIPAEPFLVGLAAVGACWTKETSYPFVALLGVLGLVLARRRTGTPVRRHFAWGTAGMAVAIVAASLFNEVRFGHVLNPNYFEAKLHTPGVARKLDYAAAVLVSPSGGMFVFWPTLSLVVLAACVLPLVRRRRGEVDARPAVVLVLAIAGLTLGLASWWTPFGWGGWGPRLALPWAPPILLLALVAYGEPLRGIAARVLAPTWRLVLVAAAVLAVTLPHVGQMWRPNRIASFFAQETVATCNAPWRGTPAQWNACQHRLMWEHRPMPLYALGGVASPGGVATAVVLALGVTGCLLLLRGELSVTEARGRPAGARAVPVRPL